MPISAILQEDRSLWLLFVVDGRRYRVAPGEPLQWCREGTSFLIDVPEEFQKDIRRAQALGVSKIERRTGPGNKSIALPVAGPSAGSGGAFSSDGRRT